MKSEMTVPISEESLPQKSENALHDSLPVYKLPKSSVTMLTRASIIPLQEQPRNHFTTSRPPQPSFFSTLSLAGYSPNQSKSRFDRKYSYYKSLVRQHGLERLEEAEEQRLKKVQASFPKPCSYFNSSKGCRLGLSCPYKHDLSSNQMQAHRVLEAPAAKRVKLNNKILLRL